MHLKGLWYMVNIPQLRAVSRPSVLRRAKEQPLATVYWPYITNPEVSYCYFKLVTNIITAVKKNACFVIPVVYGVIYYGCQPISIQDWNHTVYI